MTYEYKPDDKFGYKDTLPEGHDEKIIKGSEFDDEFKKISNAFKVLDPDFDGDIEIGGIDGLQDALDGKADQSALEKEIQDRKDGDQALQDQIDALDPDGDRNVDWDEIQNKPTEFPPEAHDQGWDTITGKPADFPPSAHDHAWSEITGKPSEFPPESHGHEIADVDGLQDALDAAGGTPAWDDVTGKPTEFPPEAHNQDWSTIENTPSEYPPEDHTHGQDEVDGLELRLEAIEGSISSGGGFVDAPNDGQLYGRQFEAWAVVPAGGASSWNDLTDKPADFPPSDHTHEIDDVNGLQDALDAAGGAPAWDDVTGKPSEFPPASHNHDGVYQPVGDYIGDAPNDGDEYARKNQGWVKLQDHNYTGADAVKLTDDQSVAGHKTWTGVATFGDTVTMRGTLNGDDTANFQNAVTAGSFVKTGGTSGEYLMADGSVSSGPAGGSIQDGDTVGQITTWSGTEWAPDSSLTIDSSGNATFSGSVSAGQSQVWDAGIYRRNMNGLAFNGVGVLPCNGSGQTGAGNADGVYDLGLSSDRFKNGYFSGTVDAAGFTVNGQPISGGGHSGNNLVIENPSAPENSRKWRFNVNTQAGYFRIQNLNDDESLKQTNFIKFNQDDTIVAVGSITAPDFIATSDERVKDNITTAPVGLIDSLKGREWDWKESGEKGSGVVAQELEQVLPHLVHEDGDGMKSVAYNGLIAYLIEEIKDLKAQVDALKNG